MVDYDVYTSPNMGAICAALGDPRLSPLRRPNNRLLGSEVLFEWMSSMFLEYGIDRSDKCRLLIWPRHIERLSNITAFVLFELDNTEKHDHVIDMFCCCDKQGRLRLQQTMDYMLEHGDSRSIALDSVPSAVGFYKKLHFRIDNRYLTKKQQKLSEAEIVATMKHIPMVRVYT